MNTEEVKRIVDGEKVEQLTKQVCHHWEVVSARLDELDDEYSPQVEACFVAEIYACILRLQSIIMTLMELNKLPSAFLFSEYLDRIGETMYDNETTHSALFLFQQINKEINIKPASFYDMFMQWFPQYFSLPKEEKEVALQGATPQQILFTTLVQNLNQENLMTAISAFQEIFSGDNEMSENKITQFFIDIHQSIDSISEKMTENLQLMLIILVIIMELPKVLVQFLQNSRSNQKAMVRVFKMVQARVCASDEWKEHWKNRLATLKVVNDSTSLKDILMKERNKVRSELGQIPGGLFAKWTTDKDDFEASFLNAGLSDDDIRHFIFHLAALQEIAQELNPKSKTDEKQLVHNDSQRVAQAVMEAAAKLSDLVTDAWYPYYNNMWQDLIQDEAIFAHLKVTRKSPHNNLFTARFFCHLVGEMKKSAIFGGHSDRDLALKLADKYSVETFRKNIQEGLGAETVKIQNIFDSIHQKYRLLARR